VLSVYLEDRPEPGSDCSSYEVADHLLLINRSVAILDRFSTITKETVTIQSPLFTNPDHITSSRTTIGWVAGKQRNVTCSRIADTGYHLLIDGIGSFTVRADGSVITFENIPGNTPDEAVIDEALLGPALTIALATRGVFCLHASAILADGHAIAFLGDSGTGKSTLAAHLPERNGWQRIADDILPVTIGEDGLLALPHFPQLKLPASQQIGPDVPSRIPLRAIYLLDIPDTLTVPSIIPLDHRTAATILIRHTVASSLFDAQLLVSHMDFCTRSATHLAARRLIYPHNFHTLPRVADLVDADIASL
jgi:hypothetical protein